MLSWIYYPGKHDKWYEVWCYDSALRRFEWTQNESKGRLCHSKNTHWVSIKCWAWHLLITAFFVFNQWPFSRLPGWLLEILSSLLHTNRLKHASFSILVGQVTPHKSVQKKFFYRIYWKNSTHLYARHIPVNSKICMHTHTETQTQLLRSLHACKDVFTDMLSLLPFCYKTR